MMEEDSPFSSAVIAHLQGLTEASYIHSAELNNYNPTETQLDTVAAAEAQHATSVYQNIQVIDNLVKAQESAIRDLRSRLDNLKKQESCTPQKAELASLKALKNGTEKAFEELPWFPEEESGLNTLLAVRGVLRVIEENRKCVSDTEKRIEEMKKTLKREREWVHTAEEIERELQKKIKELEAADRVSESETQKERRKVEEYEKTRKEMAVMSSKLIRELSKFVKSKLGLMLAVEEAGGPVVGSELNLEMLRTYLDVEEQPTSKRGKAAKARERGQRRLDELWGGGGDEDEGSVDSEKMAGEELLGLIEAMLNKILEEDAHAYTGLTRDSAASRFLVRSFVANLHPKDAMKIRLIDFAGKIEGGH